MVEGGGTRRRGRDARKERGVVNYDIYLLASTSKHENREQVYKSY